MACFDALPDISDFRSSVITASDVRKDYVFFDFVLDCGVSITSATASVNSVTSSVSAVSLAPTQRYLWYFVTAGAAIETFTLTLTVVTSDGQTLHYTVEYTVDVPRSA